LLCNQPRSLEDTLDEFGLQTVAIAMAFGSVAAAIALFLLGPKKDNLQLESGVA